MRGIDGRYMKGHHPKTEWKPGCVPWNKGHHTPSRKYFYPIHPCIWCETLTHNKKYCCRSCSGFGQNTEERRNQVSDKVRATLANVPKEIMAERIRKSARTPNRLEMYLDRVLQDNFPGEWKYVGDGQLVIEGKNPDFVNVNGKKRIIELWGELWHKNDDPEERKSTFGRYGYETLILWSREVRGNRSILIDKISKNWR